MELTWLRRSKEVSGHVGSDNDMLNGSNVLIVDVGRVSPVSTEDSVTCRFLKASTRSRRPLADL
jgi:hypothetical protein